MTGWPAWVPTGDLVLGAALLVGLAVVLWPPRVERPPRADRPPRAARPAPVSGSVGVAGSVGDARSAGVDRLLLRPAREVLRRVRRLRGGERGGDLREVHLLDSLAAALEAGLPTDRALGVAMDSVSSSGPLPPAWEDLHRCADLGLPLASSWARVARRTGSPTLAATGRAWAVATTSGAPLAAAVRSSAHAARERHRLARAVEVATAGARATATVLGLLPLAGVGLAAVLGIGPATLYGTLPALISAGAGAALLLTGHLVVRALVSRVVAGV